MTLTCWPWRPKESSDIILRIKKDQDGNETLPIISMEDSGITFLDHGVRKKITLEELVALGWKMEITRKPSKCES